VHWDGRSDRTGTYIPFGASPLTPAASPTTRAISCRVVCHPVSRSRGRASESYARLTLCKLSHPRTAFQSCDVQEFFPDKTAKLVKFPTTSDAAESAEAFCTSKSFFKNAIRSSPYTRTFTYLPIYNCAFFVPSRTHGVLLYRVYRKRSRPSCAAARTYANNDE